MEVLGGMWCCGFVVGLGEWCGAASGAGGEWVEEETGRVNVEELKSLRS